MDKLEAMNAFAKVVAAGSYAEAARRMGLTRSAVSKAVMELEHTLGARLLDRTTRRVSPTEAGRAYYERCLAILADVEDTEAQIANLHDAPRGVLRVNAPMSFGVRYLASTVADFMARYPELKIELILNDRLIDPLEEGVDVTVRIGALADSSLIARRLAPVRTLVCASPGYLAEHGTPMRPEDLMNHSYLRYSNVPERRVFAWLDEQGRERVVNPKARLVSNNGEMLKAAAEEGLGIISQPTFLIGQAINEGRLVPILTGIDWWQLGAYALYPPGRHLSAKVRALVDHLVTCFGDPPYWDDIVFESVRPRPRVLAG